MASIQNLYETVVGVFGEQAGKVISALGEITVECLPEHYISVMTALRDHEDLHFELLVDLCGVDYSTYKNEEDKEDGDEVITYVEFHPCVFKGFETAFVRRIFLGVVVFRTQNRAEQDKQHTGRKADEDEYEDGKITGQHGRT